MFLLKLLGEMSKESVGDTQIAFAILEIDRVDLVGHSGGADLACDDLELEKVAHDVGPHIAGEIDHDGVESHEVIRNFGAPVVTFDLGGERLVLELEVRDALLGDSRPIGLGEGDVVGVEVTGGAVELSLDGHALDVVQGLGKTVSETVLLRDIETRN